MLGCLPRDLRRVSPCLVAIRRLSWCSVPLRPASPLTPQVSFIEAAVIYCSLVFLPVPAIRRGGSDRLKLGGRWGEQSGALIGGHYQRALAFKLAGELAAFFF